MLKKAIIGLAMMIGSTSAHADRQTCFDILKSELEKMIKDLWKAAAYDTGALPKYRDAIGKLRRMQIDAALGCLGGR